MTDILFVSESEIKAELRLAQDEIAHYGYSLSFPVHFGKAIDHLKASTINMVLINASEKKIEAYDLCKDIKKAFRGAIKVFVFLPNSNPSEGGKFGLINAEAEDEKSIQEIVTKLPKKNNREYILEENVISVYGMHGGAGASMISILLAYVLDKLKEDSLIAESSNAGSIKRYLALEPRLPLLTRDKSRELDQAKDLDWFRGFLSKSPAISRMHYLNLFERSVDKNAYLEQSSHILNRFSTEIETFLEENTKNPKQLDQILSFLNKIPNSLRITSKELEGESYTLFDEIVQLGGKISKNIIFDLGSDIYSPLNKQLLNISNNIVLVFRDASNIKEQFQEQKEFLRERFKARIIPVIAPPHYYYSKYESLDAGDWEKILGEVPIIYPYDPETVIKFIYDKEPIKPDQKLFKFAEQILDKTTIELKKNRGKRRNSLLGFLNEKEFDYAN